MLPSSSELTYFLEVAQSANLTRAAERLGVSQPALTVAMQRLERAVGAPLLIRAKSGVALTQAGRQLLAGSRALLQAWQSVGGRAVAAASEVRGDYSIGCHVSVGHYALPAALPALLAAHPGLELRLMHELSRKITEGVVRMQIDLGIVVNPQRHPDLVVRKLLEDEVTLWAGPGAVEDVLICDPELLQTQNLLKKLRRSGLNYPRRVTTSSLEVAARLVASGAGVGILPGRVAALAGKWLRRVRGAPVFRDEICLIYRVENRSVRAIQAIGQAVSAALAPR